MTFCLSARLPGAPPIREAASGGKGGLLSNAESSVFAPPSAACRLRESKVQAGAYDRDHDERVEDRALDSNATHPAQKGEKVREIRKSFVPPILLSMLGLRQKSFLRALVTWPVID